MNACAVIMHSGRMWRHIASGGVFVVVFLSPHETIAVSYTSAWLGRATAFLTEFETVTDT